LNERDIYEMDLLEAMRLIKDSWNQVSQETIKNCWDHTKIQREPLPCIILHRPIVPSAPAESIYSLAWDIVVEFATEDWTLPQTEERLKARLGDKYVASDWVEPLDAVIFAENDVDEALEALDTLRQTLEGATTTISSDVSTSEEVVVEQLARTTQNIGIEAELQKLIDDLKARRRIFGDPPCLDDLLDPVEEHEIGEGHRTDVEIVAKMQNKTASPIEMDEDKDKDEDKDEHNLPPRLATAEMIRMCKELEIACIQHEAVEGLEASRMLRRLRAPLQAFETANTKQKTLFEFFVKK